MAFSKEDRKEVFDFFEQILIENDKPVYYDHLRGHITKASPVVKKYIIKECKGENLLKYFQLRKNYFVVDLRGEVSLKKSRYRLLSYKSVTDETNEVDSKNENDSEESNEDTEYSVSLGYSRNNSVASDRTTDCESIDGYASSHSKVTDKEKTDYREVTIKYFYGYLNRNRKVDIDFIDIEGLPKKVKRYIMKYMKNKLISFFKNNPEFFQVDDDKYVSLISPPISENVSQKKPEYVEDSPDIDESVEEAFNVSNAAAQTFENFLGCVEFFVSVLKKKNLVPLQNLSGSLSQAPPGVLVYLKSNYETYKNFLLFASFLFTVNDREEVSLTKDCFKLIKRFKKLLRFKSNTEFWSQPIENIICSLLLPESHVKICNSSLGDHRCSPMDEEQLECSFMSISNGDAFHLTNDSDLEHKSYALCSKWNSSDSEHVDMKSLDHCESDIKEVYHQIIDTKTACETLCEQKISALASDKDNCRIKEEIKQLSDDFEDSSEIDDIQVYDEILFEKSEASDELEPNGTLCDRENERLVKFAYDTSEIDEEFNDDDDNFYNEIEELNRRTSRVLIECAFTAQLLCLEVVEKEKIMALNFEYEAVKYFVEILECDFSVLLARKSIDLNTFKGKIGQAPVGVKLFLKQFYKGEKITLFFDKYDEFILDSHTSWVKLSPHYKESLANRRIENENFNRGVKIFQVQSLYNSHFHKVVAEAFDCLFKICCFLQHKSMTKFTRLCGIFSKFSTTQQEFVNSLSGSEVSEKLKKFLLYFNKLFHFQDAYIQIDSAVDIDLLVKSVTEFNKKINLFAEGSLPCFHFLLDYDITMEISPLEFDKLTEITIECVQDFLSNTSCINYSDLPDVVKFQVLYSLVLSNQDSQCLIKLLEDCGLFELKDGRIFLRNNSTETEQLSDVPVGNDETSDSHLDINDSYSMNNTFHKVDTELIHEDKEYPEQINEEPLSLNGNPSSQHQDTDIVEGDQSSCSMKSEHFLKEIWDSKQFSESVLSYDKIKTIKKSHSNSEIESMHEENEDAKQVSESNPSHHFPSSSCHFDSSVTVNDSSSSCIMETTCLNKEKEDLEQAEVIKQNVLSYDKTTGLHNQDADIVEDENSSHISDQGISKEKGNSESAEHSTKNSDYHSFQSLEVILSEKSIECVVDNSRKNSLNQNSVKAKTAEKNGRKEKMQDFANTVRDNSEEKMYDETQLELKNNLSSNLTALSNSELNNDAINDIKSDILSVHETESDTNGSVKLNQRLENNNLDISLIKSKHIEERKRGYETEFVENDSKLKKTVNKFISQSNLSPEVYETKLLESESDEIGNFELTFSLCVNDFIDGSNEHSDCNVNSENLIHSGSSSGIDEFIVNNEDSSISRRPESLATVKIAAVDEGSAEIAEDTNFPPNDDVEIGEYANNKDNFEVKEITKPSYRSYSDMCKNDENLITCRVKEKTSVVRNRHFEPNKNRENLNANSVKPACLILENSPTVNIQKEGIGSGRKKETSKLSMSSSEIASRVDIKNNKLDGGICLNTFEDSRNEKGSKKYNNIHDNVPENATVKNKTKFTEETRNDDNVPVLKDTKRNSQNACISQISKSNNKITEVSLDNQIKNSFQEKLVKENTENIVGNSNLEAKTGISRNESSSLLSVSENSIFDHSLSMHTCTETAKDKCSVKRMQRNNFKATLNHNTKIAHEESVIESNSDLTADHIKSSSHVSVSEFQKQSSQTVLPETLKTHSDSLPSCYKFSESCDLEQEFSEKCDNSDVSNRNSTFLILQPLQSKIILLTMDSCIVETVIDGCQKYIFCLKSSFHCDEHSDCSNCFNSLAVGDSVLCYVSPEADFNCGSMNFSFMLCRDSNENKGESAVSSETLNQKLHLEKSKSYGKRNKPANSNPQIYPSKNHIHVESKISECQTDFSGEIKHCSSVNEKECHVKCSTVSQSAQTVKYTERKLNTFEKECQVHISTALQGTQTVYKSSENECQTDISGVVKPFSSTDDKACQIKCTVTSLSTQTSYECDENESQTDISAEFNTPAVTSSGCQTVLSGPVKKRVYLFNKSSQASLVSSLVCQTTQTVPQNAIALESNLVPPFLDQQLHINAPAHSEHRGVAESSTNTCDMACQTISTGPIMVKRMFHI